MIKASEAGGRPNQKFANTTLNAHPSTVPLSLQRYSPVMPDGWLLDAVVGEGAGSWETSVVSDAILCIKLQRHRSDSLTPTV